MTFSPPPASSLSGRTSSPQSVPVEGTLADPVLGTAVLTRSRWLRVIFILLIAAIILTILCLQVGARYVSVGEIVGSFGRAIGLVGGDEAHMTTDTIVWHLRLPRVFLGFLVGGSLASVGVILQALLRNPLADPYILGVSSGSALGVSLAILLALAPPPGPFPACRSPASSEGCWRCSSSIACRPRPRGCRCIACYWEE